MLMGLLALAETTADSEAVDAQHNGEHHVRYFGVFMSEFREFLQSPLLPLLTFFLGVLLGHRTALWRDRRQEFNDAADPVRAWLVAEIAGPSAYRAPPGLSEMDTFVQCLHWWQRRGFDRAWKRQEEERTKAESRDAVGQAHYADSTAIVAALKDCLPFTDRR